MVRHGVALFGLGRAGQIHFGNLIRNHRVKLLYVVEMDGKKAEEILAEHNQDDVKAISPDDAIQVYEDSRVEAVIVATPTYTHEEVVIKSLKHNKAVFCEKPISGSPEGTRQCYEQAEKVGKALLCSFNRRFDPSLCAIRERVLRGEAGKVHIVRSTARDSPIPPVEYLRHSGGVFHDCVVHDLDLICWVLGQYPVSVYTIGSAHMNITKEMKDADSAIVVLKFANNVVASIDIDRGAMYGYDQRFEVFGDQGMLLSDFQHSSGVKSMDTNGSHLSKIMHSFPERYAQSYIDAMDHFINVMEDKEVCSVSKENTLTISRLADACEESYRSGAPVTIEA